MMLENVNFNLITLQQKMHQKECILVKHLHEHIANSVLRSNSEKNIRWIKNVGNNFKNVVEDMAFLKCGR